jgi:polysaccharide export outer membrane protein
MRFTKLALFIGALTFSVSAASAQDTTKGSVPGFPAATAAVSASTTPPPGYVIGAGDMLSILFFRDKDMSADVTVRPDGKISLPLLNDIAAAGYAPDELRVKLREAAAKFLEDPDVSVVVKEIKSRNVFITGQVARAGTYSLNSDMTILQLIAVAGGVLEYAHKDRIVVTRKEGGHDQFFKFNLNDYIDQKNVKQNITLKPGDTVVVP